MVKNGALRTPPAAERCVNSEAWKFYIMLMEHTDTMPSAKKANTNRDHFALSAGEV